MENKTRRFKLLHNKDENKKVIETIKTEDEVLRMALNYGLKTLSVEDAINYIEVQTGFYKFEEIL